MTKEEMKEYMKAYYQEHKEKLKARTRAYYQQHKEEMKEYMKAYYQEHKEHINAYMRSYRKVDINSMGFPKGNIRMISNIYLSKYGLKIPGYEIHHCCTYTEPYKFIYCSKDLHHRIHSYLREHNIDADTDHYDLIKHLLDDTVVKYNIE